MRRFLLLFLVCSLVSSLPCRAQQPRAELQAYVDQYKAGNALDLDAYVINLQGDTILFSDFQGKWVLIDYWTVGCKPCLKELPALAEFSRSSGLDQLEVIAISVDTDAARWKRLSEKRLKGLPNYFAGRSTSNDMLGLNLSLLEEEKDKASLYTTLPRYSLIDPSGKIAVRHLTEKPSSGSFKKYMETLMR